MIQFNVGPVPTAIKIFHFTSAGNGRFADRVVSSIKPSFCLSVRGALGLYFASHAVNFSLKPFALGIFWDVSAMFTHRQSGMRTSCIGCT